MNFSFNLPVRIVSGPNCIQKNAELLSIGSSALIVTGKHGAKKSGALDDVTDTLSKQGIEYTVFDKITENPPLETCFEGGRLAADVGAEFIIGIGGGSALDAAKAIAAFAANQQISSMDIYSAEKRTNPSLPIIAIPTTSGTGSEANPYSVLSLPGGQKKKTFTAPDSWPKVAFLDGRYTYSLSREQTLSTALDAFAHAIESYLSPKSTEISTMMAYYASSHIWDIIKDDPEEYTEFMHDRLMCASCAAGIAISITGTGFPHPLGYAITMLDGIPHGAACAVFEGDYIEYNMKSPIGKAKLLEFAEAHDTTVEILAKRLPELSGVDLAFSEEEIARRVELIADAKNYVNSPYVISKDEMYDIYRKHFLS
jgi:alcohol dehydrogenase class IV